MRCLSQRTKPELLIYDFGGCEGCPLSIIRVIVQLSQIVNVSSRYLGSVDLNRSYDYAVLTGSICLDSVRHVETLRKIRENAKIVIAYGSCASVGGITLYARGGQEPMPEHRKFTSITKLIDVDYSIPGCPPAPQTLISLLSNIKQGRGYFLDLFKASSYTSKLSGFDLIDEIVLTGLCVGCGACVLSCPTNALQMIEGHPDLIPEKCIRCGSCTVRCPRFSQLLMQRAKLLEKSRILIRGVSGEKHG